MTSALAMCKEKVENATQEKDFAEFLSDYGSSCMKANCYDQALVHLNESP